MGECWKPECPTGTYSSISIDPNDILEIRGAEKSASFSFARTRKTLDPLWRNPNKKYKGEIFMAKVYAMDELEEHERRLRFGNGSRTRK